MTGSFGLRSASSDRDRRWAGPGPGPGDVDQRRCAGGNEGLTGRRFSAVRAAVGNAGSVFLVPRDDSAARFA